MMVKLLLLLSVLQTGTCLPNIIQRENVVFNKIQDISLKRSFYQLHFPINLVDFKASMNTLLKQHRDFVTHFRNTNVWHHIQYNETDITPYVSEISQELGVFKQLRHQEMNMIQELSNLTRICKGHCRSRRSTILDISPITKWFGIASSRKQRDILNHIQTLETTDQNIIHDINSLSTVMKHSAVAIEQYRLLFKNVSIAFRNLSQTVQYIAEEQDLMSITLYRLHILTSARIHFTSEYTKLKNKLMQLQTQLSLIFQAQLSTSLVSPTLIHALLKQIKYDLPRRLDFCFDLDTELIQFYKTSRVEISLYEKGLICSIFVPLTEIESRYNVYKANLVKLPIDHEKQSNHMIYSTVKLETNSLAISEDLNYVIFLTNAELETCKHVSSKYCFVSSVIQKVASYKSHCLLDLFLHSHTNSCETLITKEPNMAQSIYLGDNVFLVTNPHSIQASQICNNESTTTIELASPVAVIKIPNGCFVQTQTYRIYSAQVGNTNIPIDPLHVNITLFEIHNTKLVDKLQHVKLPQLTAHVSNLDMKSFTLPELLTDYNDKHKLWNRAKIATPYIQYSFISIMIMLLVLYLLYYCRHSIRKQFIMRRNPKQEPGIEITEMDPIYAKIPQPTAPLNPDNQQRITIG